MRLTDEHIAFRASVRAFVETEIEPHVDEWEAAGIFLAHDLFPKAAALGLLGLERDPEYGGEEPTTPSRWSPPRSWDALGPPVWRWPSGSSR